MLLCPRHRFPTMTSGWHLVPSFLLFLVLSPCVLSFREGTEIQYSLTPSFHPHLSSTYKGYHRKWREGRRWKIGVDLKLLDRLEPASKGA